MDGIIFQKIVNEAKAGLSSSVYYPLAEANGNMGKMQIPEINGAKGKYLLPSVSTDGFEAENRSWLFPWGFLWKATF